MFGMVAYLFRFPYNLSGVRLILNNFKTSFMKTSNYEVVIKPLSNVIRYYGYQIVSIILNFICFFYLDFLSRRFTIHRTAGEGGIYLAPLYHFHPLHRHLDISRKITAESSHLHIASGRTRTVVLWFPSTSR